MILDKHVWRTTDSLDRLVWDGDPDAAILAYPKGTEIPDATARRLGLLDDGGPADEPPADMAAELETLRAENAELRAELAALSEATSADVDAKMAAGPANKARSKTADKASG